jgi:outer membrane protein assembly factor BamB
MRDEIARHDGRWRGWLSLALVLSVGAGVADAQRMAQGEISFIAGGIAPVGSAAAFRVPGESQQTTDAVADFEQMLKNKQWDKAFRAMEAFQDRQPAPMVRTADGFVVPCDLYARERLAALPPDGRRAFRVFHDAQARSLLDVPEGSAEEIAALVKVYQKFLISSVGAAAADRWGDAYFERGDFARAAQCWADVIAYCPDTTIPAARLDVTRATALARAGDAAGFEEVRARAGKKYGAEKVEIGGHEWTVAEYLATLAREQKAVPATAPDDVLAPPDRIPLPRADAPSWRYEYLSEALRRQTVLAIQNNGYSAAMMDTMGASSAGDGRRVFINWFGATTALDAGTGKVVWQTDKPEVMPQRVQRMMSYGVFHGGALLCERGVVIGLGYEQNRMPYARLACYAADTGAVKWNTATQPGLSNYCFLGGPVIAGGVVYGAALKEMRGELSLIALDFATGAKLWEVVLGTPTQNSRGGYNIDLDPQIEAAGNRVFVLTNDGALVAVDPLEKRVSWAYMYGAGRKMAPRRRRGALPPVTADQSGDLAVEQGVLYFKDKGQDQVHALDINGRGVLWKKEAGTTDAILGIIDGDLYVLGDALTAYKPRTFERRWWSELFGENAGEPLFTRSEVYLFGSKGLFDIDRKTGKVVQMMTDFEQDPSGGAVLAAGKTLILITDTAAVGYAVSP